MAVYLSATGGIGPLVASLGTSFSDAFSKLIATPNPSPSEVVATDAPIIAPPGQPYTNSATATLHVTVPVDVAGTTATVRVYVALQGLSLTPVDDVPVGSTTQLQVQVDLAKGRNDFTATIVRNGVESPEAPVVTIVLDQDPPKITITSPKDGASISDSSVTIVGTTQAGSDVLAQNGANGSSVTGTADSGGKFSLTLPLDQGSNAIQIRATDPAGNQTTMTLTVKQGSGELQASLHASKYTISISHLPTYLQVWVVVTDPTGAPLVGASASFVVQIPGLGPISNTLITDANGRAVFTINVVSKPTTGNGLATVVVSYENFATATDNVPLTFIK